MAYDKELFRSILSQDSTSGKERELGLWLYEHLEAPEKELMEVGDGTLNLFLRWRTPRVVFCTHMDTVPPYIAPTCEGGVWRGRGTCDAKGQLISMYTACKQLEAAGCTGFGPLILAGEETGSLVQEKRAGTVHASTNNPSNRLIFIWFCLLNVVGGMTKRAEIDDFRSVRQRELSLAAVFLILVRHGDDAFKTGLNFLAFGGLILVFHLYIRLLFHIH